MSDAAASSPAASVGAAAIEDDERLAYRSVFQRIFIRPEVGAVIGAIGVWTFFWAVSGTFGTAGASFGWIDIVASSLGIMAVAVAALMIGGEDAVVRRLEPIFETIAPGFDAVPRTEGITGPPKPGECGWLHCGPAGAGRRRDYSASAGVIWRSAE